MRAVPLGLAWLCGALLLASPAAAQPAVGGLVPAFTALDLARRPHNSRSLVGRPTALIVVTGRAATARTRAWLDEFARRYPGDRVQVVTIITLRLGPVPPLAMVRAALRRRIEARFWGVTWLDGHGEMERALALRMQATQPFIIALDASGRVRAVVHGELTRASGGVVWEVLDAR